MCAGTPNAVQEHTVQCRNTQCSAGTHSAVQRGAVHEHRVQCSAGTYSAVQCGAVLHSNGFITTDGRRPTALL